MPDSFETPWTVAYQAPLSMGFPQQKCWSGLQFPSPGDLPRPGIKPVSPILAGGCFTIMPPGKPRKQVTSFQKKMLEEIKFKSSLFQNGKNKQTNKQKKNRRTKRSLIPGDFKAQYEYFIRLPGLGGVFSGSSLPLLC